MTAYEKAISSLLEKVFGSVRRSESNPKVFQYNSIAINKLIIGKILIHIADGDEAGIQLDCRVDLPDHSSGLLYVSDVDVIAGWIDEVKSYGTHLIGTPTLIETDESFWHLSVKTSLTIFNDLDGVSDAEGAQQKLYELLYETRHMLPLYRHLVQEELLPDEWEQVVSSQGISVH